MARGVRFQPSDDGEAKNKTATPRTQNNATNSWYFGTQANGNGKNIANLAIPFFAYTKQAIAKIIESMHEYITIDDVYEGYKDCKRHKASTEGCVEYMQNYLANNLQLYRDLNNMTYEIGQSKAFCVTRPKLREVFCAQFRDRVVHHILANKFIDIFETEMLDCAYACRKGKGTLYGIEHVRRQTAEVSRGYTLETWVLKCDLQGFFMSIDRQMAYRVVEGIIRHRYDGDDTEWWLWLWRKIILHDPTKNCVRTGDLSLWDGLPANKSLFTCGEGKGFPIGNLPSQIMANLIMSRFDKWITDYLGDKCGYGRYVDDFIAVSRDKKQLLNVLRDARVFLDHNLGLTLHPKKIYLQEARKGVVFTGACIMPGRTYCGENTVQHLFERIEEWNSTADASMSQTKAFARSVNSLFGHLKHYSSYAIRWRAWKAIKRKESVYCENMYKLKLRRNNEKNELCKDVCAERPVQGKGRERRCVHRAS